MSAKSTRPPTAEVESGVVVIRAKLKPKHASVRIHLASRDERQFKSGSVYSFSPSEWVIVSRYFNRCDNAGNVI